jgi:predicted transcriptional regulator
MTTMKSMETKGHLKKRTQGRAFVYAATVPERRVLRQIVGDFLDRVFNGSAEPLLAHLVEERRLSEQDLAEIARMIREKERKH